MSIFLWKESDSLKSYDEFQKLCEAKGCNHSDVSKATGIYPSALSDWKNNRSKPKFEKLILISRFFNVSVEIFADF